MTAVIFNPATFKAAYPEFAAVADPALSVCFDQGCMYLSNGDCSPVQNLTRREMLLNLLTAHIAQLRGLRNVNPGAGPVGRASSATEGSVSVSLEYGVSTNNKAWFVQTQYGAMFWQATLSLRSFRYMPRPTRF